MVVHIAIYMYWMAGSYSLLLPSIKLFNALQYARKIEIIFVVRHAPVGLISIGIRILMLGVCVANKVYK